MDIKTITSELTKSLSHILKTSIVSVLMWIVFMILTSAFLLTIIISVKGSLGITNSWFVAPLLFFVSIVSGIIIGLIRGLKSGAKKIFIKNKHLHEYSNQTLREIVNRIPAEKVNQDLLKLLSSKISDKKEQFDPDKNNTDQIPSKNILKRLQSKLMRIFHVSMYKAFTKMSTELDQSNLLNLNKTELIDKLSNQLIKRIDDFMIISINQLFLKPLIISYSLSFLVISMLLLILITI